MLEEAAMEAGMAQGRMSVSQRFENIRVIRDIDVFEDGRLWEVSVLVERLVAGEDEELEVREDATILNITLQEAAEQFIAVRIPEGVLENTRRRFARLKGVSE